MIVSFRDLPVQNASVSSPLLRHLHQSAEREDNFVGLMGRTERELGASQPLEGAASKYLEDPREKPIMGGEHSDRAELRYGVRSRCLADKRNMVKLPWLI